MTHILTGPDPVPGAELGQGLFGGYAVYNHFINTRMLSLQRALQWTTVYRERSQLDQKYVMIASSFNMRKAVLINCDPADDEFGAVFIRAGDHSVCKASPAASGGDGFLVWMEEFAKRVETKYYGYIEEDIGMEEPLTCLSLFPRHGPLRSSAATNGVLVECSAVVMPEFGSHVEEGEAGPLLRRRAWSYSVEFSAAAAAAAASTSADGANDDGGGAAHFVSAQLESRHWHFEDEEGPPQAVDGPGVIGLYPTVTRGMTKPIIYQSQTRILEYINPDVGMTQSSCDGKIPHMRGHFKFVEGTRAAPTGPSFDAVCARINFINEECVF